MPFSDTFAHPGDPLPVHLERVAERAGAGVAPWSRREVGQIAFLAGLFHDIGKATPWFQEYLFTTHRKTRLTPHARSGAVLSWWFTGTMELPLWQRLAVFVAVLRHHGSLNFDAWQQPLLNARADSREADHPLVRQLAALDLAGIGRWLTGVVDRHRSVFGNDVAVAPPTLEAVIAALGERKAAGRRALQAPFTDLGQVTAFLAGFGALLSTDKLDAALEGQAPPRPPLPVGAVGAYLAQYPPASSPLNDRRQAIAATVRRTWLAALDEPLLTLTAPTGSGKTLTILDAALGVREAIARREGFAPRLIYCLPFTSVIDQNHGVIRSVLAAGGMADREDVLLKHHHLVDGTFRTEVAEHAPDGAGQLLTETWRSEIVVTTFHQLLHSLLSPHNGSLKRAGQLTGALVLLDEVQALPLGYWQGLRRLFQAAAAALGCRFVLLTATRPLILRPEDAQELLPDHRDHFLALARVRLICHHHRPLTLGDFVTELVARLTADPRPALIILNRRRAVAQVFQGLAEAFPGRRLIALSTDLTPRDRRARIRLIRRLQARGEDCLVVSTQLVEAGVDISFPVVHRDLAPLDAIIQCAGRCNRHAWGDRLGEVHLWHLHRDRDGQLGEPLWSRVYDAPLIQVTRRVLGERAEWSEGDFLELSQRYFEGCWQTRDQAQLDQWLIDGDFPRLGREFRLIEDGPPRRALLVVRTEADRRLWQRYQAIRADENLSPLEREQAFRTFRADFYERVIQVYGPADREEPIGCLEADGQHYCRATGYISNPDEDNTSWIF